MLKEAQLGLIPFGRTCVEATEGGRLFPGPWALPLSHTMLQRWPQSRSGQGEVR